MRLYVTPAGRWAGTQAEARQFAKENGGVWTEKNVPADKAGLIAFLNENRIGNFEGEWDALPLSHKLSFAAKAVQEARRLVEA